MFSVGLCLVWVCVSRGHLIESRVCREWALNRFNRVLIASGLSNREWALNRIGHLIESRVGT